MVELNTSDDTIAELKRQAASLEADADLAGVSAAGCDDDRVRANLLAAKSRFLAIRANVLAGLLRVQRDREAAGQGAGSVDPEEVERKSLVLLRARGWRCER